MKATAISLFVLCYLLFPATAGADIVVFKNGQQISVKACRVEGDMATLHLREGGEVTFPAAIVDRVEPDEVPYPEPGVGNGDPGTVEASAAPAITPALVPDGASRHGLTPS